MSQTPPDSDTDTRPHDTEAPRGPGAHDELNRFEATGPLELGLAGDGWLRYAVVDLTEVVEEARVKLDLAPIPAVALGRAMAAATLLLRMVTKTPSRLLLEIRGDGPLQNVLVETDGAGGLRGSVSPAMVDLPSRPDGKLPVGEAIGSGTLRVVREHGESRAASYSSHVELVSGEIGLDLAHFLRQSEQMPSAVLVGVLTRPEGVVGAGGMIIEPLPGTPEETLQALEANLADLAGVSWLIEDGGHREAVETVLAGLDREVIDRRTIRHRCRCRRELLKRHLQMVPEEELAKLRTPSGLIEGECAFCGSLYRFTPDELTVTGRA